MWMKFFWPVPLSVVLFFLFRDGQWDEGFSAIFYAEGMMGSSGWVLADHFLVKLAYKGIPILTAFWGVISILVLILSFRIPSLQRFRSLSLLCLAVLIVGPGLTVNALLKDNWGRPRPRDTEAFGGQEAYQAPFVMSSKGGKSFPNGHASVAFSLVAFAFWIGRKSRWFWIWMFVGLFLGAYVGIARIAVGGHYLSDTLVSGFLIVGLAWLLNHCIPALGQPAIDRAVTRSPLLGKRMERGAIAGLCVFGAIFATVSFLAFPISSKVVFPLDDCGLVDARPLPFTIRLVAGSGVQLREPYVYSCDKGSSFEGLATISGFGFPGSRIDIRSELLPSSTAEGYDYLISADTKGWITEWSVVVSLGVKADEPVSQARTE